MSTMMVVIMTIIECISLSLTPFGELPYVCMHDMCVSACTCMCVHIDANMSLYIIYNIINERELCTYIILICSQCIIICNL